MKQHSDIIKSDEEVAYAHIFSLTPKLRFQLDSTYNLPSCLKIILLWRCSETTDEMLGVQCFQCKLKLIIKLFLQKTEGRLHLYTISHFKSALACSKI